MSLLPEGQLCRPGTGAEELGLELFDEFVSISAIEIISGKSTVHTSMEQKRITARFLNQQHPDVNNESWKNGKILVSKIVTRENFPPLDATENKNSASTKTCSKKNFKLQETT